MRKLFALILALAAFGAASKAQTNVMVSQLAHSTDSYHEAATGLNVEAVMAAPRSLSYALVCANFSDAGSYFFAQLFQELKFWDAPLSLYGEFRTSDFAENIGYLGLVIPLKSKHGTFKFKPLIRNSSLNIYGRGKKFQWKGYTGAQLSFTTSHDWDWVNYQSFTDIYDATGRGNLSWNSEHWLFFPVSGRIDLGTILKLRGGWDYGKELSHSLFISVRLKFSK